jgi:RNA polymerase sigma factor (sigma-70 family)
MHTTNAVSTMSMLVPNRVMPARVMGYTRAPHGRGTERRVRAHPGLCNETSLAHPSTTKPTADDAAPDDAREVSRTDSAGPRSDEAVRPNDAASSSSHAGSTKADSEPTLLQRVGQGEPGAVTACIDRFGGLVWTLARRMSPTNTDAEDAVQEIFTEIWQHADRYDPSVASETAFVAMITRRRLIDRYRRSSRVPSMMPVDEKFDSPTLGATEDRTELSEESVRVLAAMESLSKDQQQVLRLSLIQGLSHEKIARSLDMPLGTVKTHARRGLIRLRDSLKSTSSAAETRSGSGVGSAGGDVPGGAS